MFTKYKFTYVCIIHNGIYILPEVLHLTPPPQNVIALPLLPSTQSHFKQKFSGYVIQKPVPGIYSTNGFFWYHNRRAIKTNYVFKPLLYSLWWGFQQLFTQITLNTVRYPVRPFWKASVHFFPLFAAVRSFRLSVSCLQCSVT